MQKDVSIKTDYITLGQFLKRINAIQSGGMAKWFLQEKQVSVNGEKEMRRGRKLYVGDQVFIEGCGKYIVTS